MLNYFIIQSIVNHSFILDKYNHLLLGKDVDWFSVDEHFWFLESCSRSSGKLPQ